MQGATSRLPVLASLAGIWSWCGKLLFCPQPTGNTCTLALVPGRVLKAEECGHQTERPLDAAAHEAQGGPSTGHGSISANQKLMSPPLIFPPQRGISATPLELLAGGEGTGEWGRPRAWRILWYRKCFSSPWSHIEYIHSYLKQIKHTPQIYLYWKYLLLKFYYYLFYALKLFLFQFSILPQRKISISFFHISLWF